MQDLSQFQHAVRSGGSASVVAIPTTNITKYSQSVDKSSPKFRTRANTIINVKHPSSTDDIVTTTKSAKPRGKGKGNKVERSQTFLGKEEKKDRPRTAHGAYHVQAHSRTSSLAGGPGLDDFPDGGKFYSKAR